MTKKTDNNSARSLRTRDFTIITLGSVISMFGIPMIYLNVTGEFLRE